MNDPHAFRDTCAVLPPLRPPDGGMRGGYAVRFLLIDTVEDAELFDKQVWADEAGAASEDPGDIAQALGAGDTGTAFASTCRSSGIQPDTTLTTGQFPLVYKGSKVDVTIVAKPSAAALTETEQEDATRGAPKLDLQLVARRSGRGSKTVTTLKGVMASTYGVDGYMLSPWESRMLVVFSTTAPGFEGDMSTTLGFAGCHLEVGYR
jgi:hypothetical protein